MTRPRIRAAKFADIPAIHGMIQEGRDRSRYAPKADVVEKMSKGLVMQAIQRHGGDKMGATFVAVAENGKGLEGFIIGVLQPLYGVLDAIEATDIFWYASPGADARTAGRLLKAMHKWVPAGSIIRHGNSDAISDADLSGRLLERCGMRLSGHIYEKEKVE